MSKICWKGRAFKALSFGKNSKKAGRNFSGNITIFHRGGGSKKLLRRIDFQRKNLAKGTIERIEYDPNRTARIALVRWSNIRLNNSVDKYAPGKLGSSVSSLLTSSVDGGTTSKQKMLAVKSPSCLDFSIGEYLLGSGSRNVKTRQRFTPGHQFANVHVNEGRKRQGLTSVCFRATTFLAHKVLDSSKKSELGYSTEHPKESVSIEKWRREANKSQLGNDKSELTDEGAGAQRGFSDSQKYSTRNAMRLAEKGSQGCVSYILASEKLMPGDEVFNMDTSLTAKGPLDQGGLEQLYQKSGISLPLLLAPIGSVLHNIELSPGGAGKLARAAGTCAQLVQKPNRSALISRLQTGVLGEKYALPETDEALTTLGVSFFEDGSKKPLRERKSQEQHTLLTREFAADQERSVPRGASLCTIRLPSGQHQLLDLRCRATIGSVSNIDHKTRKLKKAGHSRWLGIRPVVRGVAMNPIDHPHGGGEGRTKGGRPSVSPWGKPAKRARRQTLRALRISASSN